MSVKREIFIIVIGIAVLAVLGFVGIKYIPSKKTVENKVEENRSLLLSGKLSVVVGRIAAVKDGAVTVKISAQGHPKNGQEEEMMFTADAVIRKIVFSETTPAEGEMVPAKEVIVPVSDLKVGDNLVMYLAEDGRIKMADLMPSANR